jgi:hypothetical protein
MGSDASKTERERFELERFLEDSKLPIDRSTIEKLEGESLPDFRCREASGRDIAFELTAICAEELAQLLATAASNPGRFVLTADPTRRIVEQKMRKSYAISLPIDLLCYWDARTVSTDDMILPTIVELASSVPNPFQRVWYNGEKGCHLAWTAT